MTKNVRRPAIIRLYRNTSDQDCSAGDSGNMLCQYTCLDRIGRDFTTIEICRHIMLRLLPALKKRMVKYARMSKRAFMKRWRHDTTSISIDPDILHKDLSRGEAVSVLPYHDIEPMLNNQFKYKGLSFLNGMKPYCGRPATVFTEPRLVLDHGGRKIQKCKNLVICEKLYCDGTSIRCDRACLYYWKKDWLKEAP